MVRLQLCQFCFGALESGRLPRFGRKYSPRYVSTEIDSSIEKKNLVGTSYLAADKCGEDGWIIVLLDADDDCPAELGIKILERAHVCIPHRRVSVVLANREYEAWFIAAAESLNGLRGFSFDPTEIIDAETPRDAKGWIKRHKSDKSYGETTDQPAFSARMDLQLVFDRSRSFRKLCTEWSRQVLGE